MKDLEIVKGMTEIQHGVVARFQLVDNGLSNSSINSLVKSGVLQYAARGVYKTIGSQVNWHQRAAVAVLSCGRNAMLSHESVLINYGLLSENPFHGSRKRRPKYLQWKIHVLSRRKERFDNDAFFHRSINIDDYEDIHVLNGIRQAPIERALIDCAQQFTTDELDFNIQRAISAGHTDVKTLGSAVQNIGTAPGREKSRIQWIFAHYLETDGYISKTESVLEKRVERILRRTVPGLFTSQHEVIIHGKRYRLDFAILSQKIAIEVDGFEFRKNRSRFDSDRVRQNDLVAAGWKVIRITSIMSEDQISELVLRSLSA